MDENEIITRQNEIITLLENHIKELKEKLEIKELKIEELRRESSKARNILTEILNK